MKKRNSNSISKKPKLYFHEERGQNYLVISVKKYKMRQCRSISCQSNKRQCNNYSKQNISPFSRNPDYYYQNRQIRQTRQTRQTRQKNFIQNDNPYGISIICKYNKELQKENMLLKRQNKVLYNYITSTDETDQYKKQQKYQKKKKKYQNQLKEDYLLEDYDQNLFRSTYASIRH